MRPPLPIAELLDRLRREGLPLGVDDYAATERLIALETPWHYEKLRWALRAALARSTEEQAIFDRAFTQWIAEIHSQEAVEGEAAAGAPSRLPASPGRKRAVAALGTAALLALALALVFWFRPPPDEPTVPDEPVEMVEQAPLDEAVPAAADEVEALETAPELPEPLEVEDAPLPGEQPEEPAVPDEAPQDLLEVPTVQEGEQSKLYAWLAGASVLVAAILGLFALFIATRPAPAAPLGPPYTFVPSLAPRRRGIGLDMQAVEDMAAGLSFTMLGTASRTLDVEGTVAATVDNAGLPSPVFLRPPPSPRYAVLVDRGAGPVATWVIQLFERLRSAGVRTEIFTYQGVPRAITPTDGPKLELSMAKLAERQFAALVMVGNSDAAFDPARTGRADWVVGLERFPDRIWFETRLREHWGAGARLLTDVAKTQVVPLTVEGIRLAKPGEDIPREEDDWPEWPWFLDQQPSAVLSLGALEAWLGGAWTPLCALALMPMPSPEHLDWLAERYFTGLTEADRLRLLMLPWVQDARWPPELRLALAEKLRQTDPSLFERVETAVAEALAARKPSPGSLAHLRWEVASVEHAVVAHPDRAPSEIERLTQSHPKAEAILGRSDTVRAWRAGVRRGVAATSGTSSTGGKAGLTRFFESLPRPRAMAVATALLPILCVGGAAWLWAWIEQIPDDRPWLVQYADADGDGFGDLTDFRLHREPIDERVEEAGDCNDENAEIHPEAGEICNGVDDDCDGEVDEVEDIKGEAPIGYVDRDGDGFGDMRAVVSGLVVTSCSLPEGYARNQDDCDDSNRDIHPGRTEILNKIDDDCDGEIDTIYWWPDEDSDGFGDANGARIMDDEPIAGRVRNGADCDDTRADIHPGAEEWTDEAIADIEAYADGIDNDCDGMIDEIRWLRDVDGDGFPGSDTEGALMISAGVREPRGFVPARLEPDCDDTRPSVHPGAEEQCNGRDDDCDGVVDGANAVGARTWYHDDDKDGHGSPTDVTKACSAPAGYARRGDDCDDDDASVHPDSREFCNGKDDDCDGSVDELGATDEAIWYEDEDGDGWGSDLVFALGCVQPEGYSARRGDCDDHDHTIHPGAMESCNHKDDDCDGEMDESGAIGETVWYLDADRDGWGATRRNISPTKSACSQPVGFVANDQDCDDTKATVYPGAEEKCNGMDDDCNGATDEGKVCSRSERVCDYARADVSKYAESAMQAFIEMRHESWELALGDMEGAVICYSDQLTEAEWKQVYVVRAWQHFLESDREATNQEFFKILSLDPDYTMPTGMAPVGHDFTIAFEAARATVKRTAPSCEYTQEDIIERKNFALFTYDNRQWERFDKYVQVMEVALACAGEQLSKQEWVEVHFVRALHATHHQSSIDHWEDAADDFEEILKLDPDFTLSWPHNIGGSKMSIALSQARERMGMEPE